MLLANVTQQIVPTREALCSTTAFDMTEQLCRRRCVLPFVSVAVFGVDEAFLADAALVRPLGALQVRFLVTSAQESVRRGGNGARSSTSDRICD